MNNRIYIDINNEVGKRSDIINSIIPYEIDELIEEHKRIGIDQCMISSSKAQTYSIIKGNDEVINYCLNNSYLVPIATLYPGVEYDIREINAYFEKLHNVGIKGINLDVSKLFIYNPNLFNKVFEKAEQFELPIIVDWNKIEDKEVFFNTAKKYRNLDIVVVNINWAFKKYIIEYMKENNNLSIGINGFIYQNMIEEFCELFSSKRLLFSSGYPYYDIGSVKAMIEYSNITESEKDDISHKNAEKLFKTKIENKIKYDMKLDKISKIVDDALKLDKNLGVEIIDAHTHFVSDSAEIVDWIGSSKGIDSLIKSAKKLGISKIITSPMDGLLFDGIIGNISTDEVIKSNKIPTCGYVTANPYYDEDKNFALAKIEDENYCGVKLYPSKNGYPYDGKLYEELLNKTASLGKYFLLHGTPEDAQKILEKYNDLKVLLAHSTQSYEFMDKVIPMIKKYDNLYIDICNRYSTNKAIEYLVKNVGSNKIVFGSDSNLLSQSNHVGWLAYSDIEEKDKINIFSTNAKKLMKRR